MEQWSRDWRVDETIDRYMDILERMEILQYSLLGERLEQQIRQGPNLPDGGYVCIAGISFRRRASAAALASLNGLLHRASGGSQMPSSFFISSTFSSHRFSQYTVIRLFALPPHFKAQGTYSEYSLCRFCAVNRIGPNMAESAVIGKPKLANSKNLRASSDSTLTGRLQIQW